RLCIGCLLVSFAIFLAGCTRSSSGTAWVAGDSNGGPPLTKVTLQADWYPQPEHGGFYTALLKGYYKDEGLDLTIQPGSQYLVPDPLVAVAATMQNDPQGIMVRQDSQIRTFTDLHGHTVAVKPGSTWFQFLVKR